MGHRSETVYEELHDGLHLGEFETDIPASSDDRVVYNLVELARPQRRLLHVVVWKRWSDVNLLLNGVASEAAKSPGYCRRVGTTQSVRVCVVGDRVTASGRPRFLTELKARLRLDGLAGH
jgi:hypothetical protein